MSGSLATPVVVMGVAGCGKTAVGKALAQRMKAVFIEGDALHPPENVARMRRGEPLDDADRAGWLDAVGAAMAEAAAAGNRPVAACSALKRSYRDRLRRAVPEVVFVFLDIDRQTAAARVSGRKNHFMPASLVDSQFAALEPPGADEHAVPLDATMPLGELIAEAVRRLGVR